MKLLFINPYFEGRVYTPSIGLLVLATTVRRELPGGMDKLRLSVSVLNMRKQTCARMTS